MEESRKKLIEDRIAYGYDFAIGRYLQEGWEIYKKFAGGFIGFLLLTMVINFVAGLVPVVGFIASTFILGPALQAGNYLVSEKIQKGKNFSFNDFFRGFDHIGQLALMTLILMLILLAVFTPTLFAFSSSGIFAWYREVLGDPFGAADAPLPDLSGRLVGITLLNLIPVIYLSVAYMWGSMFIVFFKAAAWEALETSRRLITRRWFTVFGLLLAIFGAFLIVYIPTIVLVALVPVLGIVLAFFVGLAVFLVAPAIYCILYAAFADVTELITPTEDDLEDHLVE